MLELLVLAVVPAVLLLVYVYHKDRYEPEPKYLVAKVFLLGALSVLPAGILEMPFPPGLFSSAVVAPVVEEGLKFCVVYFTVYKLAEFDEPMDGIVYAAAAGLGFAAVENIFYVMEGGLAVAILRGFLSVPGHVIFSCIWGAALGIAKFRPESERARIIILGLAGAMLVHGLFNLSLELFDLLGLAIVTLVIVPLGWWVLHQNIETAHHQPNAAHILADKSHPASMGSEVVVPTKLSTDTATRTNPTTIRGVSAGGTAERGPAEIRGTTGFCTDCGAPHSAGARHCRACGKPLDA
ncbi:MAG: PrsW family glutamic-type intramembrane protease [Methanomicrobiales archaeon]